ncbi:MAG TPA: hypothetical protein VEA58_02900 [Anaerovoracaceae bacterium]|nr:hypothetical protein [Anaerovoracaceae bacterium]
MKKNIFKFFNRKKDILAAVNTKKDVYSVSGKREKILAFIKNKIKFIVIFLILILAAAMLIIFWGSKEASGEKSSEEKKTEFVQKDEEENAETEDSDSGNLENHLGSDFIKTLKSGNYLIKYRTTTVYDGKSFEVETTYAVSGDSIAMISQDRATIVKDNKVYMLNHADKTMISWNVDHTSDNLKRIDTEGLVYLGSSQEGNLLCEEYATELTNIKLYFDGEALVKMSPDMNRQDIIMDIVEVSEEVPETMFQVPTGYRATNL